MIDGKIYEKVLSKFDSTKVLEKKTTQVGIFFNDSGNNDDENDDEDNGVCKTYDHDDYSDHDNKGIKTDPKHSTRIQNGPTTIQMWSETIQKCAFKQNKNHRVVAKAAIEPIIHFVQSITGINRWHNTTEMRRSLAFLTLI